jgi:two-component sensor histidine kinase/CheY-like chemotaxis protein
LNDELEHRVAERTEALALSGDRLRQSEQGRGLALAAGNMGSWDFELASGTWFWDEGQSHIFGVDHAAFVPSVESVRKGLFFEDIDEIRASVGKLSPDNATCKIEFRIVRPTGEIRWCSTVAVASFDAAGVPIRFSGVTTDITERKEAENRQTLLAREVDHRAKNTLAVVQAIVRMAKRDSIDGYVKAVEGRVTALAQAHELLSQSRWEGADVQRLILEELAPYHGEGQPRVAAIGPSLVLVPEQAQLVAMAIHELATNAAKYGSLSVESGRVDVSWYTLDGKLFLNWTETGGPVVVPPARLGFGTKIISSLGDSHGGRTHFGWRPAGLNFTLELRYRDKAEAPSGHSNGISPVQQTQTENCRLLLVEDELLVGIFMQDLLQEIGYQSTDPIGRLSEAMAAAANERFDGAVLDMNLNGEMVYPLAELLTKQSVPFVFVTGYAPRNIDPKFTAVPILQKPVVQEDLAGILQDVLAPKAAKEQRAAAVR